MAKIILICGKICSGKTYYANKIKEKERAVILSTDEATFDLINNEQGEFYNIFDERLNKYLRKKAVEICKNGCN
ncbi:MAG: AAA family ATPase, partial [Clostridia bacterium]|nr:AAA family ATPase [Clostridia bacterium]